MPTNSPRRSPTWPSASSKVVGVIGDPVAHSLSPLLHQVAFDAMDLDWVSVAFRVAPDHLSDALAGMRAFEIAGLSVTTPHKEAAAEGADELSPLARRLGAANCLSWRAGKLFGESTDGEGFVQALRRGAGFDPRGTRCGVLGAGGAARAVVLALAEAGAGEVLIVNRTPARAAAASSLAGPVGRVGAPEDLAAAELVVQATSLGMAGGQLTMPVDPDVLHAGQLVAELVYEPRVTAFMEAAHARGARTFGGMGMLVHQAALAIERWTGDHAPLEAMWKAAAEHVPRA